MIWSFLVLKLSNFLELLGVYLYFADGKNSLGLDIDKLEVTGVICGETISRRMNLNQERDIPDKN